MRITISSGRQEEVRDLTRDEEREVIDHIRRYGGRSRSDLHGAIKGFSGFAYSADKPFKMEEFHYGFDEISNAAENRSVTEATRAALAADYSVRTADGGRTAMSTEVEMTEEHPQKKGAGRKMKITIDPSVSNGDSIPLQ